MKKLFGVTTAMVTPFDAHGLVDQDKLAQLTEFLISKGVHCLYPLGTTGEMLRISTAERKLAAETVVRQAAGRATVYIHAGAMNLEDTVELARHAAEIGADGIGAVTPMFFGANPRELTQYYSAVAAAVPGDFPVYLYNIPQCSANDLTAETAAGIAGRHPNVIGIKYSLPDLLRTGQYLQIGDGSFSVVQGTDRLFLPSLAMGCAGTVSGVSCVYPEPFIAVYDSFRAGDLEAARKWQALAVRYCEALQNGSNMAYFKTGLRHRGIDAGHMKAPQLDLSAQEAEQLVAELRRIDAAAALL